MSIDTLASFHCNIYVRGDLVLDVENFRKFLIDLRDKNGSYFLFSMYKNVCIPNNRYDFIIANKDTIYRISFKNFTITKEPNNGRLVL